MIFMKAFNYYVGVSHKWYLYVEYSCFHHHVLIMRVAAFYIISACFRTTTE